MENTTMVKLWLNASQTGLKNLAYWQQVSEYSKARYLPFLYPLSRLQFLYGLQKDSEDNMSITWLIALAMVLVLGALGLYLTRKLN